MSVGPLRRSTPERTHRAEETSTSWLRSVAQRLGLVAQRHVGGAIASNTLPEDVKTGAASALDALAQTLDARASTVDALDRSSVVKKVDLGAILARVAPVSETLTQRTAELPYKLPPIVTIAAPGQPLDLSTLDPSQRHVWTLDPQGRFVIAPEVQKDFGITDAHPEGRKVKHGDLAPGPGGQSRGPARAGGELYRAEKADGTSTWVIDLSSSYCFNRTDGRVLGEQSARAVVDYLSAIGSDVKSLDVGKNTFDPLRKLAGRALLVLEKLGLGGHGL